MTKSVHTRSTRRAILAAAMLAMVAMACTCGGSSLLPTVAPTAAPVINPPAIEQPGGSGSASGNSLLVINNSGLEVCYLYVSPQSSDSWGDDQLGADTIANGTSYEIFDVPPGIYDLRAEACDGVNFAENFGADLSSGDFEWTLTP